jgi:acyl carrier protein
MHIDLEKKSQEWDEICLKHFDKILRSVSSTIKESAIITLNSQFREDLDLDDLEFYEFLYRIEEKFKISISDERANEFNRLSDYSNYLKRNYPGILTQT